ncbi:hypothetical protein J2Z23_001240 [Lederbergia galactosidilyticus]|nr:hypothetical protein [Lederbergia galactosidilytica]
MEESPYVLEERYSLNIQILYFEFIIFPVKRQVSKASLNKVNSKV